MSLPMAVKTEGSVVRAMAASARRSRRKRPTSSAAKCCASAAEPPLPKVRTLPPERRHSAIRPPTSTSSRAFSSKNRFLRAMLSAAASRMPCSFMSRGIIGQRDARRIGLQRPDVHGEQDGQDGGVGEGHLEDRPIGHAGRYAHRHREPPLHLAFAHAASAIEEGAARTFAGGTAGRERDVQRQHASARGLVGREQYLAAQAAGPHGPPQVAHGGAAHEGPGQRLEPLLVQALVVAAAPLGVGQRLVGGLEVLEVLSRSVGGHVGMEFLGQPPVGPLDGSHRRVPGHAKDQVVILELFHPNYTICRGRKSCQGLDRPSPASRIIPCSRSHPRHSVLDSRGDKAMFPEIDSTLQAIFRWFHIVFGVMWIGHLYFFNFVNTPFQGGLDKDLKPKVNPPLVLRALFFFRWGAMWTLLFGLDRKSTRLNSSHQI